MTSDPQATTGATPKQDYQFGLKTLFALPLLVVAYFALAHWLDPCAAAALTIPLGLLFACFYRPLRRLAIWTLFAYLFIILLMPFGGGSREAPRRSQCTNNLKQIGLALHYYHDVYGSFPPGYITDDEGRPIHSWRVLILPFLEQQPLYDRYRFDEPWDGPNNIKLVKEMPSVFRCPSEDTEDKACTNYVAVIGPRTAWPGETPVRFSDIADGASNTWLVVEAANSGIAWSEPRDLHVLQMAPQINPPAGQGISSKHPGGAQVLYADGSMHYISEATSSPSEVYSEHIRNALTIAGGDPVDPDW